MDQYYGSYNYRTDGSRSGCAQGLMVQGLVVHGLMINDLIVYSLVIQGVMVDWVCLFSFLDCLRLGSLWVFFDLWVTWFRGLELCCCIWLRTVSSGLIWGYTNFDLIHLYNQSRQFRGHLVQLLDQLIIWVAGFILYVLQMLVIGSTLKISKIILSFAVIGCCQQVLEFVVIG